MPEEKYITLGGEGVAEYEEKKSVFIGHAMPAKTERDAVSYIKEIRQLHSDARHNVHAFLIGNGVIARSTDDGEPSGSAGVPVLEVIRKSGITDACVVVTRYFGGILLGAGGLVRAYSAAAKAAIDKAGIVTYEAYTVMKISCNYSDYQKLLPELTKVSAVIDGTEYSDNVTVIFAIRDVCVSPFTEKVREMSAGKISPEIIGKRYDCR